MKVEKGVEGKEEYKKEKRKYSKMREKKKKRRREKRIKKTRKARMEKKVWEIIRKERRRRREMEKEIKEEEWREYFMRLLGGVGKRVRTGERRGKEEMKGIERGVIQATRAV